ncbi:hypothetical protein [Streptomyces sp. NPDC046942]
MYGVVVSHGTELPALGVSVEGEVRRHAHNHQVRVRLDEWPAAGE